MSKYTTGEVAKLCGVSVRTVQYYDTRNILVPSELSDGGRRLYSEQDLKKMHIICFLREMDVPINSISQLFSEKDPESVISIILSQQEQLLKSEISERQHQLEMLWELRQKLRSVDDFSVESIGDIAHIMENRKRMRKIRAIMLTVGILVEILEIGTLLLWVFRDIWWPFAVALPLIIAACISISMFYYKKVSFICPKCHDIFNPTFKQNFFAYHIPPQPESLPAPNADTRASVWKPTLKRIRKKASSSDDAFNFAIYLF